MKRGITGVTLIELMVVVAIVALLATIAYPNDMNSVRAGRRSEAYQAIFSLQSQVEACYPTSGSNCSATSLASMGQTLPSVTKNGFYTISIQALTSTSYTIVAVPVSSTDQNNDTDCMSLYITNTGTRSISGAGTVQGCWGSN
jgi:type IV pilus assembly protein PilE